MAVPLYTTDLTTINAGEATTGWAEPGTWVAGGLPVAEIDYFIQGTGCISKSFNATGLGGLVYDNAAGVTIPADGAYMAWIYYSAPNAIDTEVNGGYRLIVGSALTAFNAWKIIGSDTYAYGGWKCVCVNPAVTVDYTVGVPTSTLQIFGSAINSVNAVAKGNPFGIDAIRYGRCEARIANGSVADGFATFNGFASTNDSVTNRWGLIQAIDGGYLQQGLVVFGHTTAVDFRDSNKSIIIANTKKVSANFNTFEVRQATSRVDLTSVSFLALGTVSKGRWVTTDNATININSCTFTDMGTFSFLAQSTINTSTFRRTGQITTGGAIFDKCTIDNNTATSAMLTSSPANAALISNTAFTSDGTGHAIEITGTAANMTLTGNTYSGYAASDGSTGNESIFVNIATGSMNLTVSGGGTPSIRTAGAAVTVISGAVTVTATVKDTLGTNIQNARVLMLAATGGLMPFDVTVTITRVTTTATVTHTAHGMATNDKVQIKSANEIEYNGVYSITKIDNNSYSYTVSGTPATPATGTIKCHYVALSGLTDASGVITMSRVFSSAQPISGRVRKSTGSPIYKTSNIIGTISSTAGLSSTILMIADE